MSKKSSTFATDLQRLASMSNIKPHIRISPTAVSMTFVDDIRAIIEQGKQQAYMSVNASMIETYWHIGERIVKEEQQGSNVLNMAHRLLTTSLKNWQMSTAKVTLRVTFVPSGSSMLFSPILTFGNRGFQI